MRASEWRIQWAAAGGNPRTLLDFGDLMPEAASRALSQAVDIGRFDFARSATPAGRGNVRRRMEFSRVVEHDTAAGSWEACSAALAADPWGEKDVLSVQPEGDVARYYAAALLSSRHEPVADAGLAESLHGYAFRVSPVSALVLPGGLVITGGYWNAPGGYVVPQLPPGIIISPGDEVIISGPGGPSGPWTVLPPGLPGGGGGPISVWPVTDEPEPMTPASFSMALGHGGRTGGTLQAPIQVRVRYTLDWTLPPGWSLDHERMVGRVSGTLFEVWAGLTYDSGVGTLWSYRWPEPIEGTILNFPQNPAAQIEVPFPQFPNDPPARYTLTESTRMAVAIKRTTEAGTERRRIFFNPPWQAAVTLNEAEPFTKTVSVPGSHFINLANPGSGPTGAHTEVDNS